MTDQQALADTPQEWTDVSTVPIGELARRCGVQLTECTPERVAASMPVEGNRQPFGLLHGGASAMLAETIGSVHATMLAGPGRVAVGVELNCTHHRPATGGMVTAVSTPLHVGRTVTTLHIDIRDESGRPLCTARLTCMARTAAAPGGAPAGSAQDKGGDTAR
jgi:uncharacterized protein (TIGR00369 family)